MSFMAKYGLFSFTYRPSFKSSIHTLIANGRTHFFASKRLEHSLLTVGIDEENTGLSARATHYYIWLPPWEEE